MTLLHLLSIVTPFVATIAWTIYTRILYKNGEKYGVPIVITLCFLLLGITQLADFLIGG